MQRSNEVNNLKRALENEFVDNFRQYLKESSWILHSDGFNSYCFSEFNDLIDYFLDEYYNIDFVEDTKIIDLFKNLNFSDTLYIASEIHEYYKDGGIDNEMTLILDKSDEWDNVHREIKFMTTYRYVYASYLVQCYYNNLDIDYNLFIPTWKDIRRLLNLCKKLYNINCAYRYLKWDQQTRRHREYPVQLMRKKIKNLSFKLQLKQELNKTRLTSDIIDNIVKLV